MLVYFVIGESPELEAKVKSAYPDYHDEIKGGWLVAADKKTASDVAESLGMNGTDMIEGIVVQATSYNGYYSNSLWEKISLWRDEVV